MNELRVFLDNLWFWKCGCEEKTFNRKIDSYDDLKESEWDKDFENKMRNRLIFGAMRYGKMGHGSYPKDKKKRDRIQSIKKRLEFFEQTGNGENLVDIANECLLIYAEQDHSNFHFEAKDDSYHTPEK